MPRFADMPYYDRVRRKDAANLRRRIKPLARLRARVERTTRPPTPEETKRLGLPVLKEQPGMPVMATRFFVEPALRPNPLTREMDRLDAEIAHLQEMLRAIVEDDHPTLSIPCLGWRR